MEKIRLRYGPWHRGQAGLSSRCVCSPSQPGGGRTHDPANPGCRYSPDFRDRFEEHAVDSASVAAGGLDYYVSLDYEADETAFFIVKWAVRPAGSQGTYTTRSHGCSEPFQSETRFFIADAQGRPVIEVEADFDPGSQ